MTVLPACSCGAQIRLCDLLRLHLVAWPGDELLGGECPHCGSTRYQPADTVSADEAAACDGLEAVIMGGNVGYVLSRDLDAVAPTEPPEGEHP